MVFKAAYGGWFSESDECMIVLELRKSQFSNYYYLRTKVYVQQAFGKTYNLNKDLFGHDVCHVLYSNDAGFKDIFSLDSDLPHDARMEKCNQLFLQIVMPFVHKAKTRQGLQDLEDEGIIKLLPAVKGELEKLRGR